MRNVFSTVRTFALACAGGLAITVAAHAGSLDPNSVEAQTGMSDADILYFFAGVVHEGPPTADDAQVTEQLFNILRAEAAGMLDYTGASQSAALTGTSANEPDAVYQQ